MFITLQLDLSAIGALMRENPDLAKKVQFKNGTHQLLNITIQDKKEPDRNGNNVNVSCKPKDAPYDSKWYIGQGKLWADKNQNQAASNAVAPTSTSDDGEPLPF